MLSIYIWFTMFEVIKCKIIKFLAFETLLISASLIIEMFIPFQEGIEKVVLFDLFKKPRMRIITLCMWFAW